MLEFWLFIHANEFSTEEWIGLLSERVNLFEVLTVDIIDNSSDPTVGAYICELEISLHSVHPCNDVDVSVALELLDLALGLETGGGGRLTMVMVILIFTFFCLELVLFLGGGLIEGADVSSEDSLVSCAYSLSSLRVRVNLASPQETDSSPESSELSELSEDVGDDDDDESDSLSFLNFTFFFFL